MFELWLLSNCERIGLIRRPGPVDNDELIDYGGMKFKITGVRCHDELILVDVVPFKNTKGETQKFH